MDPVERLVRLAALERQDLLVIVVYAVAIGLVSLAVPIAAQALVNTVAFTALPQPVLVLAGLVLLGLLAAGLLRLLQLQVVETLQMRLFVRATHEAAERIVRADVDALRDRGAVELVNRFLDVALLQKTASTLLVDGASVVLQGAVSLVLLAFYHPALLAFDVALMVGIAVIFFGLGRGGIATAIKESKVKYATAAWLEEVAGALRTFKAESAGRFALRRADELAREYVQARGKHFSVVRRQTAASYVLQAFATAGLLGLGGALVMAGQLTLGQLVAAELIVTAVLAGVAKFGKYLESYYDLVASLDKVGAIVDLGSERADGASWPRRAEPARVSLAEVSFSYDGRTRALSGVSFEVAPGAHVAVLGTDASGKSTLVDLLYGLRAPTGGRLEIDGVDVRSLALPELRRDVAVVGRPEVVDGTVLDNVRLGAHDADATAVARALHAVALTDEVAGLPEGVGTRVGHSGNRLTSSQAARLVVARALVARPRLLIVDETLDGLGVATVRRVLAGIAAEARDTSVIVCTSREDVAAAVGGVLRLAGGALQPAEGGAP